MTPRPDHRAPTLAEIADNPTTQIVYAANQADTTTRLQLLAWAQRQPEHVDHEIQRLQRERHQWTEAITTLERLATQPPRNQR